MVTLSGKTLLPEERKAVTGGSLERGCRWEGDAEKLSLTCGSSCQECLEQNADSGV